MIAYQCSNNWIMYNYFNPLWLHLKWCHGNIFIWKHFFKFEVSIFTRGQFWPSGIVVVCVCVCVCLCVCQSLACPRDNSGPVQATITKFGPKMQKTLVKIPIVLWTNRPWPSRSDLTWKSKFTPFWACPHHNSPLIQARITKFGPEVQNTLVKTPIVLGAIDLDLQGQIWLKRQIFRFYHTWNT